MRAVAHAGERADLLHRAEPPQRVDALRRFGAVEEVRAFAGVGHCPHDEAPERVNPFVLEFLARLRE